MVKVPTLLVRGLQSDRYPPATVERLTKEYPQIQQVPVQSQHDVAAHGAGRADRAASRSSSGPPEPPWQTAEPVARIPVLF